MNDHVHLLRTTRRNILALIDGLSSDQLQIIPDGFNNNLLWHVGHVLATQQLLVYGLSGVALRLDAAIIDAFRKGTKPSRMYSQEEIDQFKALLLHTADWMEEDLQTGKFTAFTSYATSYQVTLNTLEDALRFANVHEALHLGYMMAQKRTLSLS